MKKLLAVLGLLSLVACETDITPVEKEFVLPTETEEPKEITLPYQTNGIKLELVEETGAEYLYGKLYFIDNVKGFSTKGINLYKTTNGGKNWDIKFSAPTGIRDINFVKINASIGFASGYLGWSLRKPNPYIPNGWIARTNNGGESWKIIFNNPNIEVYSISSITSKPGVLLAAVSGIIMRSEDYGDTWSTVYEGSNSNGSIITLTDQLLLIKSYGVGLISKDYGKSWTEISTESIDELQGIHAKKERNGNVTGVGYLTSQLEGENWGSTVFLTYFNVESLGLRDRLPAFQLSCCETLDDFRFQNLALQENGGPIFTGQAYDIEGYAKDGTLIVYPESKWIPLILKGDNFGPTGYLWTIDGVQCFDWGCYFRVATCWNDGCGYQFIRLTYLNN